MFPLLRRSDDNDDILCLLSCFREIMFVSDLWLKKEREKVDTSAPCSLAYGNIFSTHSARRWPSLIIIVMIPHDYLSSILTILFAAKTRIRIPDRANFLQKAAAPRLSIATFALFHSIVQCTFWFSQNDFFKMKWVCEAYWSVQFYFLSIAIIVRLIEGKKYSFNSIKYDWL